MTPTEQQIAVCLLAASEYDRTHTIKDIDPVELKLLADQHWEWVWDCTAPMVEAGYEDHSIDDLYLGSRVYGSDIPVDPSVYAWVHSRLGSGVGLWEQDWGEFSQKFHKLAVFQGRLHGLYPADNGTLRCHGVY